MIHRVVSAPAPSLTTLPIRTIAQSVPALPESLTITGYGRAYSERDSGVQRTGIVYTQRTDHRGDSFLSLPGGPLEQISCPGDSGGPLLAAGQIVGVLFGGAAGDRNRLCATAINDIHMNAVKYRDAIMEAAHALVPECVPPPTCWGEYIYGTSFPPAPPCTQPHGGMGNWRYASRGFPAVTLQSMPAFCNNTDDQGNPLLPPDNRSYVGVTLLDGAGPSSPDGGISTPAMCSCIPCGTVLTEVTAAGGLSPLPGQVCRPGCRVPNRADIDFLRIHVVSRTIRDTGAPPRYLPLPIGTPLHPQDFNYDATECVETHCVPIGARCNE